jgi:bifunctional DNase/RNase
MVEMSVAGIALDASTRNPIVLLRDPSGRRQVPIWIDQAQAQNILAGLSPQQLPRPLSHDLMVAMLNAAGLQLERVIIHSIEDATFRAVLKLKSASSSEPIELDARPSDAIALAVRTGSSIWMLEEVVADASIPVNAVADAVDQADFRRFLETISPAEMVRQMGRARADSDISQPTGTDPNQPRAPIQTAPDQPPAASPPEGQHPGGPAAPPSSADPAAADPAAADRPANDPAAADQAGTEQAGTDRDGTDRAASDSAATDQDAAELDVRAQGASGRGSSGQSPAPTEQPSAGQQPAQPRSEPPADQPPGGAP